MQVTNVRLAVIRETGEGGRVESFFLFFVATRNTLTDNKSKSTVILGLDQITYLLPNR